MEMEHLQVHAASLESRLDESRDTIENLSLKLHDEKLHVASLELKNSELEKLLREKRKLLSTFQTRSRGEEDAFGGKSYKDTQQRFAFKKAEDFANALIANRRHTSAPLNVGSRVLAQYSWCSHYLDTKSLNDNATADTEELLAMDRISVSTKASSEEEKFRGSLEVENAR